MLTSNQKSALRGVLTDEIARAESGDRVDEASFVGYLPEDFESVVHIASGLGFHVVDCELFRHTRCSTEEFRNRIEYDGHSAFCLLMPRVIPFSIAVFLYQLYDHGIVSTESSFSSGREYLTASGKAWVIMMNAHDFDDIELETGWAPSRFTRVLSPYCWLHDERYG